MDRKIPLSIRNALSSSFSIIEELIEEIDNVFKKEENLFLKIERRIDKKGQKKIEENIKQIKTILKNLKKEFNLDEEKISDKTIISSRCAKIWEILNDVKGNKLRKYGEVPDYLKKYLDPEIEKILKLINEIVDL
mgnify:CR=1 FL=1